MEKEKKVARYLIHSYEKITGTQFENSELKLQKLMYLSQRESLCLTGKVLFDKSFEGWEHGPVLTSLRFFFEQDYEPIGCEDDSELSEAEKYVIDNVVSQYGMFEAWYLRNLTHKEFSWQKSREGLGPYDMGDKEISIEDIIIDAKKVRQYDHLYDMYVDEFEDYDEVSYG